MYDKFGYESTEKIHTQTTSNSEVCIGNLELLNAPKEGVLGVLGVHVLCVSPKKKCAAGTRS